MLDGDRVRWTKLVAGFESADLSRGSSPPAAFGRNSPRGGVTHATMREATQLALVRHGHTLANGSAVGMRMSGWTDTPLSGDGMLEALLLAEALSRRSSFVAIYTSPLQRARHTAAPIQAALGIPVIVDPGLREIFCGEVDGRSIEHVRAYHPEVWARNIEESDEHFRWPGGESYREFRVRCLRSLRTIAARHRGERVLVVTHAGVISQVVGWIHGDSCSRWSSFRPSNASISTVEWGLRRRAVVQFDDHAHVAALARARATSPQRGG